MEKKKWIKISIAKYIIEEELDDEEKKDKIVKKLRRFGFTDEKAIEESISGLVLESYLEGLDDMMEK